MSFKQSSPTPFSIIKKLLEIGRKSVCKIFFIYGQKEGKGTGFLCEIEYKGIPFKKALITANYILNEDSIKLGKKIIIELDGKQSEIEISNNRKVFMDKDLDYTCIEIFENFNEALKIENQADIIKEKDCFLISYPFGNEISLSCGIIKNTDKGLIHTCSTGNGSGGAPIIIYSENKFSVIGIHIGFIQDKNFRIGNKISLILENIKEKCNK